MVAKNDITGDSIKTKATSKAYSDNYDLIWGKKTPQQKDDAIAEDEAFKMIKNEYQDILSTEECVEEALEKLAEERLTDLFVRTNNRV
jgi:hypothetical protein